jgi:hypothetical protein
MHTSLIEHELLGYPFSAWPLLSCSQEPTEWHTQVVNNSTILNEHFSPGALHEHIELYQQI